MANSHASGEPVGAGISRIHTNASVNSIVQQISLLASDRIIAFNRELSALKGLKNANAK
jgi:hypothetical protein